MHGTARYEPGLGAIIAKLEPPSATCSRCPPNRLRLRLTGSGPKPAANDAARMSESLRL